MVCSILIYYYDIIINNSILFPIDIAITFFQRQRDKFPE